MKVYIAKRIYDYEGFDIIGVFSTKEKAQEACDKKKGGDSRCIEEFEIDA